MKKNKKTSTVLLIVIFVAGLSLLLYPSIANYVNELHGSRAINDYSRSVSNLKQEEYEKILQDARDYNKRLSERGTHYTLNDEQKTSYTELLNIGGDGIMGYIEIPSIAVSLPIYHGTSDEVLQRAVGHLEWTSLPVGGTSSHCVLSGHRGLPSAKLFTHLDRMAVGDVFVLRILNEVLTYEVDQILIVLPENSSDLQIEQGKDYCTLVTCTPYGINSHRLLVRGHRIENLLDANSIHVTAEALQVEPMIITFIVGLPSVILIVVIVFLLSSRKKSKKASKQEGNNK